MEAADFLSLLEVVLLLFFFFCRNLKYIVDCDLKIKFQEYFIFLMSLYCILDMFFSGHNQPQSMHA